MARGRLGKFAKCVVAKPGGRWVEEVQYTPSRGAGPGRSGRADESRCRRAEGGHEWRTRWRMEEMAKRPAAVRRAGREIEGAVRGVLRGQTKAAGFLWRVGGIGQQLPRRACLLRIWEASKGAPLQARMPQTYGDGCGSPDVRHPCEEY